MDFNRQLEIERLKDELESQRVINETLRVKQVMHQVILDSLPEAVILFISNPRSIIYNNKFLEFYKRKSNKSLENELIKGSELASLINIGFTEEDFLKVLESDTFCYTEYTESSGIHTDRYYEINLNSLIEAENEGSIGYILTIRDNTEKKILLHQEKENSKFLESLIDSIPIPVFYKNKEGTYLFTNTAYEMYAGLHKDKIIGKNVFDIFPEKLAEKYDKEEQVLYKKKKSLRYETLIPYIDGTLHDGLITKILYHDSEQNVKGSIGTILDIHDLKNTKLTLAFHQNFEKLLLEISSTFINILPSDVDMMIEKSLQKIVAFTDIDAGYFFQLSESNKYFSMTHLYSRVKTKKVKEYFNHIPLDYLPYFQSSINKGDVININLTCKLPEEAVNERKILDQLSVVSMIAVPVYWQTQVISYLGFSSNKDSHKWTENESRLLRFAGEVFISALQRKKHVNAIIYREKILNTITLNFKRFIISKEWEQNVVHLLASLGKCISAGRMFLASVTKEDEKTYFNYDYEWCNTDIDTLLNENKLKKLDLTSTPLKDLLDISKKGEVVRGYIEDFDEYPRHFFSLFGIKSILFFPVFVENKHWGVLGVSENISSERVWLDVETELLKIVANFIGLLIERGIALKALSEEEEKFRNIFEQSNESVVITDFKGNVVLANRKFWQGKFTGTNKKSRNLLEFIDIEGKKDFISNVERLLQSKEKSVFVEYNFHNHENIKKVEINCKLVDYKRQKSLLVIIRDITLQKEMERKLLETVIQTEEKERQRFAEDLHDELGPLLSGIKLYISELENEFETKEQRKELTGYLEEMVDEAVRKIRTISNNLMPNVLIDYGLEKGLTAFVNKINLVSDIVIDLKMAIEDVSMETTLEIVIYRILIELINNTLKHANAKIININVKKEKSNVVIEYKDDGNGFNIKDVLKSNKGIGISSLLNRLTTVKGVYKFNSRKSGGARYLFTIPIV